MRLSFKLLARQTSGRFEVDVGSQTPGGYRPVRIWLYASGHIKAMNGSAEVELSAYQADVWYVFVVEVDTAAQTYSVRINNLDVLTNAGYAEFAAPQKSASSLPVQNEFSSTEIAAPGDNHPPRL